MSDAINVTPPIDEIPADLKAHCESFRAMADAHNLLAEANFPAKKFQSVMTVLAFLKAIHDGALEIAAKHEKADLVPELKAYKEKLAQSV
jgi:hypothetical protein